MHSTMFRVQAETFLSHTQDKIASVWAALSHSWKTLYSINEVIDRVQGCLWMAEHRSDQRCFLLGVRQKGLVSHPDHR